MPRISAKHSFTSAASAQLAASRRRLDPGWYCCRASYSPRSLAVKSTHVSAVRRECRVTSVPLKRSAHRW